MDKSVWRKLIPILISNAVCWFYALSFVPLAYMYNEFPGQDTLVMSVATIPSLICMFAGLAAAPMMRKMDKKTVVIIGLILSAGGGLLVRYFGSGNIWVALIGSAITGIPAGLISAANYAALAEIAPEDMRDKVCGWGDFVCSFGMMLSSALAGYLCADGNWVRAYDCYYISLLVLVLVFVMYPSLPPTAAEVEAASGEAAAKKTPMPAFIIGLLAIKLLTGCFYMVSALNLSDLVINETQMGDAVLVGNGRTVFSLVSMAAALMVFAWIKGFKGLSMPVGLALQAALLFSIPKIGSPMLLIVVLGITGLMNQANYSTSSTLATMAAPAGAVEVATSLFVTFSFLGEFLGGYVPAFCANLFLGNTLPSSCFYVAAVALAILAVASFPFCQKAFKAAFEQENAAE